MNQVVFESNLFGQVIPDNSNIKLNKKTFYLAYQRLGRVSFFVAQWGFSKESAPPLLVPAGTSLTESPLPIDNRNGPVRRIYADSANLTFHLVYFLPAPVFRFDRVVKGKQGRVGASPCLRRGWLAGE
ncbi:MAG: hypothetical protein OER96_06275 [Gammaproteobacteria bacterium]|nr:hypothetical protein [Gammaproteobacteria bacterium]